MPDFMCKDREQFIGAVVFNKSIKEGNALLLPKPRKEMEIRAEEIAQERAVTAAKPEGVMREIEQGDQVRERLTRELAAAEQAVAEAGSAAQDADRAFAAANEALADARENRAGLAARAENQDSRRIEMTRSSGERFR